MRYEERQAYLLETLRRAPEGSARRTWALAMLQALQAQAAKRGQPGRGGQRRRGGA